MADSWADKIDDKFPSIVEVLEKLSINSLSLGGIGLPAAAQLSGVIINNAAAYGAGIESAKHYAQKQANNIPTTGNNYPINDEQRAPMLTAAAILKVAGFNDKAKTMIELIQPQAKSKAA